MNVDAPMLQLGFMYCALSIYLPYYFWYRGTGKFTEIAIWKLFLCAVVDTHATLFITFAYTMTSITSVMIIEDASIPSAVILSIILLRVAYFRRHWLAISICVCGISIGFINDFLYFEKSGTASKPIIGDIFAISGAFLYALENVLTEYLVKKNEDVFNFVGWLGLFGALISFTYAAILGEY